MNCRQSGARDAFVQSEHELGEAGSKEDGEDSPGTIGWLCHAAVRLRIERICGRRWPLDRSRNRV